MIYKIILKEQKYTYVHIYCIYLTYKIIRELEKRKIVEKQSVNDNGARKFSIQWNELTR